MSYLQRAGAHLAQLDAQNLRRTVEPYQPGPLLDFASNDYLGLSRHPQVLEAFRRAQRVGAGAARLLSGRHREHSLLEEELAQWLGRERVLLFSSGYLAALGATTVLAQLVEQVHSDEFNHASLIDGLRLSHTPRHIFPHTSLPLRESDAPATLVVTESLFSMDGDIANLSALLASLHDDDVLLIDEAHALGLFGASGAGFARDLDDPRIVIIGTLSKALGGLGGFVAGPATFIEYLANTARTFIFDTALPPALALAARVALSLARNAEDRRLRLREHIEHLSKGLQSIGLPRPTAPTQIVPIVLGSQDRALAAARMLLDRRIYAPAIRPPTVPVDSSRLRITLRSDHEREHIELLVEGLQRWIATS